MNALRVFFVGGMTSYRALFHWMNPWIFVPMLVVLPATELIFFAYVGRASHTATDSFFVVGNSLFAAALPGLFGMGHAISGERRSQTLPVLLASPANRLALFIGRAVPAILNGIVVAVFCFVIGTLLLHFNPPTTALPGLLVVVLACAFSCTALGVCVGALGLRGRNVSVVADMLTGLLLLLVGANVPLARLPDWAQAIGRALPLTHGIQAAHAILGGQSISDATRPLELELLIGAVYLVVGIAMLHWFERAGRLSASLDTF
jgi:ABC-2 type transport system permease protein